MPKVYVIEALAWSTRDFSIGDEPHAHRSIALHHACDRLDSEPGSRRRGIIRHFDGIASGAERPGSELRGRAAPRAFDDRDSRFLGRAVGAKARDLGLVGGLCARGERPRRGVRSSRPDCANRTESRVDVSAVDEARSRSRQRTRGRRSVSRVDGVESGRARHTGAQRNRVALSQAEDLPDGSEQALRIHDTLVRLEYTPPDPIDRNASLPIAHAVAYARGLIAAHPRRLKAWSRYIAAITSVRSSISRCSTPTKENGKGARDTRFTRVLCGA